MIEIKLRTALIVLFLTAIAFSWQGYRAGKMIAEYDCASKLEAKSGE